MIKGCIFDLDGTLLDTLESIAASFNRCLDRFGFPTHPAQDYRYFIGDGLRKCVERALPRANLDEQTIDAFMSAQRADYGATWQERVVIYDEIPQLLSTLAGMGVKLAVLSNKDHPFTVQCVTHFFPDVHFDLIQGHTNAVPHKPDPTGARRIMTELDLSAREMAVIGDTWADMATANACGMCAVGVLWGFREREELKNAGAAHIIEHPLALLAVIRPKET